MVIQHFVPCSQCHFMDTSTETVCISPGLFDFVTTEPANTIEVPDMEVVLARFPMALDVPRWYGNLHLG